MKIILVFGIIALLIWGRYWFCRGRFLSKAKGILDKHPNFTLLYDLTREDNTDELKRWLELYEEYTKTKDLTRVKELQTELELTG